MGEFSVDWLTLREPADRRARSREVASRVSAHMGSIAADGRSEPRTIRALDLGTGTGSNVRAVAPWLPPRQHWRLLDRDSDLLRTVPKHMAPWSLDRGALASGSATMFRAVGADLHCEIVCTSADLATLADPVVSPMRLRPLFEDRDLVTASALLDLVSEAWVRSLATECQRVQAAVLFTLTYDGRMTCEPEDAYDDTVKDLVNRHQRSTKGFGRALGPEAAETTRRLFEAAGYELVTATSDWTLAPAEMELQRALIEGWSQAAVEIDRDANDLITAWTERRLAFLNAGISSIRVGHQDIGGWPRAAGA